MTAPNLIENVFKAAWKCGNADNCKLVPELYELNTALHALPALPPSPVIVPADLLQQMRDYLNSEAQPQPFINELDALLREQGAT